MEVRSRDRVLGAGFVAGLALATISSSAIVADRIARGRSWVVMATDAVAAATTVLVLAIACRRFFEAPGPGRVPVARPAGVRRGPFGEVSAQAAGAALGVLLVHLALRSSPLRACAWLCERPPQLVNDFVAVSGALALLWTCARERAGALSSLVAVGISVAYSLTSPRWHLDAWSDAARGGAHPISVQIAVLIQLAGTAVGGAALRRLLRPKSARSISAEKDDDARPRSLTGAAYPVSELRGRGDRGGPVPRTPPRASRAGGTRRRDLARQVSDP